MDHVDTSTAAVWSAVSLMTVLFIATHSILSIGTEKLPILLLWTHSFPNLTYIFL